MALTKAKLVAWQKAKADLDAAKATEMELRTEICESVLGDKTKGVMHFKKFGLDTAATGRENQKILTDVLKTIFKKLSPDEKACIKYKPELKSKEYKALPKDSIFHKAVETKPGTPALEIKPIKTKE